MSALEKTNGPVRVDLRPTISGPLTAQADQGKVPQTGQSRSQFHTLDPGGSNLSQFALSMDHSPLS
jgi:hypothetical protein